MIQRRPTRLVSSVCDILRDRWRSAPLLLSLQVRRNARGDETLRGSEHASSSQVEYFTQRSKPAHAVRWYALQRLPWERA